MIHDVGPELEDQLFGISLGNSALSLASNFLAAGSERTHRPADDLGGSQKSTDSDASEASDADERVRGPKTSASR